MEGNNLNDVYFDKLDIYEYLSILQIQVYIGCRKVTDVDLSLDFLRKLSLYDIRILYLKNNEWVMQRGPYNIELRKFSYVSFLDDDISAGYLHMELL